VVNPTSLTDPLGLGPCDGNRNGAACNHDPHLNDAAGNANSGGSCYLDGIQTNCGVVYGILNDGSGGTVVRASGGSLIFGVPIPAGSEQSTLIDPDTGEVIAGGDTFYYPGSFQVVSVPIPGLGALVDIGTWLGRIHQAGKQWAASIP
jgi:hypothetical protein